MNGAEFIRLIRCLHELYEIEMWWKMQRLGSFCREVCRIVIPHGICVEWRKA